MVDEDTGAGRGQPAGMQDVFQSGSSVSVDFLVGNVGADPQHRLGSGNFQHRVVLRITGRQLRQWEDGSWEYLPLMAAVKDAGFEEIGVYILKRQNMVAQYIVTQPILDLCESLVQRPGSWVSRRRWEKEGIDLASARERAAATEDDEEERIVEEEEQGETIDKN